MQDRDKQGFIESLPDRVNEFKAQSRDYRQGSPVAEQLIRTMALNLAEAANTHHLTELYEAAKAVEHASEAELIPRLAALSKTISAMHTPASGHEDPGILIISEDAAIASQMSSAIKGQFIEDPIFIALNAAQADEHLTAHPFSLIIMDLILPDADGREVLRRIKYEHALPAAVYVLSPVENDNIRVECMGLGADKVFVKPINVNKLAVTVKNLLGKTDKRELSLVPMGEETAKKATPDYAPIETADYHIDLRGKNILLVEDEIMQANLLKMRLIKQGLAVKHAANGKDAIQMLKQERFSLVILDIMMPVLDGFTVLKMIRKDPDLKQIPVIMLSGMGSEEDIIRGYDLGATDYILKPPSPVQLIARIKSLLKN